MWTKSTQTPTTRQPSMKLPKHSPPLLSHSISISSNALIQGQSRQFTTTSTRYLQTCRNFTLSSRALAPRISKTVMALRISFSSSPPLRSSAPSPPPPSSSSLCINPAFKGTNRRATGVAASGLSKGGAGQGERAVMVRSSSLDTAAPVVGQVTDVSKDTFWPLVKAAGSKIVVLDMYTQWCGPCKVIAPKFQELSEKHLDVVFLKLDCNQENRPLAKELGIRVVPTFKILKDSKVVKEVTGAKIEDLVAAIETVKSS